MGTKFLLLTSKKGNERGAVALLMVLALSTCMVMLLSSIYIYVVNRAKYHARVKAAYNAQSAMEEAAKMMRQVYDQTNGGSNTPPLTTCTDANGNTFNGFTVTTPDGSTYCFKTAKHKAMVGKEEMIAYEAVSPEAQQPVLHWLPAQFKAVNGFIARIDGFFDDTVRASPSRVQVGSDFDPNFFYSKPSVVGFLLKTLESEKSFAIGPTDCNNFGVASDNFSQCMTGYDYAIHDCGSLTTGGTVITSCANQICDANYPPPPNANTPCRNGVNAGAPDIFRTQIFAAAFQAEQDMAAKGDHTCDSSSGGDQVACWSVLGNAICMKFNTYDSQDCNTWITQMTQAQFSGNTSPGGNPDKCAGATFTEGSPCIWGCSRFCFCQNGLLADGVSCGGNVAIYTRDFPDLRQTNTVINCLHNGGSTSDCYFSACNSSQAQGMKYRGTSTGQSCNDQTCSPSGVSNIIQECTNANLALGSATTGTSEHGWGSELTCVKPTGNKTDGTPITDDDLSNNATTCGDAALLASNSQVKAWCNQKCTLCKGTNCASITVYLQRGTSNVPLRQAVKFVRPKDM